MNNLTLDQFYSVLLLVIALCTIIGFFVGKQSDAKKQGKCEGESEAGIKKDIEFLTKLVQEVKQELTNMKEKMESSDKENFKYHKEQEIVIAELKSSYRSLHKRVDFLFDKLELREVYHDNGDTGDK